MISWRHRPFRRVVPVALVCCVAVLAPEHVAGAESEPAPTVGSTVSLVVSSTGPAGDVVAAAEEAGEVAGAHEVPALDLTVVEVDAASVADVTDALRSDSAVQSVEPDRPIRISSSVVPNEPTWSSHWGAASTGMPSAWGRTTGSSTVLVAVIDTGVSPVGDLAGRLDVGVNLVDPSHPTDTTDDHGHGTDVATVVAALGNNGSGVAGQCWQCRILPIKALDSAGNGSMADVAQGIVIAADRGAKVINISAGGPDTLTALASAVQYAHARGAVVVAAAGNDGSTAPNYPAAIPLVISVAATDDHAQIYSWSNRSASTVDVAAPGCLPAVDPGGSVHWFCGTSAASPFAAGLAALMRSQRPELDADEIRAVLESTTVPLMPSGLVSHGIVNGNAATAAMAGETPPPPPPPDLAPSGTIGLVNGWTYSGVVNVAVSATDDVMLSGVALFVNGSPVAGTAIGTRTTWLVLAWNSASQADGPTRVQAQFTDSVGNVAWSPPVDLIVDNNAPLSIIWSPGTFSPIYGPVDVVVGADDAVGVDVTIVIMNGQWIGAFKGAGFGVVRAYPTSAGRTDLVAVTIDLSGHVAFSNQVVVDYRPPPPPPPPRRSTRRRRR